MAGMPRMLVFWDADGNARWSLDHMVLLDDERRVVGLIDFEAHELAGGRMRDIAEKEHAVGAGTWPEWLDPRAFKVELEPSPGTARARIKALVHRTSGHRRVRATIESEIASRIETKRNEAASRGHQLRALARAERMEDADSIPDPKPEPTDIRDLVGGPTRPLLLDAEGKTRPRVKAKRPNLPVVRRNV